MDSVDIKLFDHFDNLRDGIQGNIRYIVPGEKFFQRGTEHIARMISVGEHFQRFRLQILLCLHFERNDFIPDLQNKIHLCMTGIRIPIKEPGFLVTNQFLVNELFRERPISAIQYIEQVSFPVATRNSG